MGPALQRLVDATQAIVGDFKTNINDINDIIQHSGPILDSQVNSGDAIERWARNLNTLAAQTAQNDQHVKSILSQAAPTADQVNEVFSDVRDSLPQTLANLEVVFDLLKRYHNGVEQVLVFLPQGAAIAQTVAAPFPNYGRTRPGVVDQPAAAVSDRLHSGIGVAVSGGHQPGAAAERNLLQDSDGLRRPTACADRATFRVWMSPASGRPRHGSAATPSPTCRLGPTPGTATRTRS